MYITRSIIYIRQIRKDINLIFYHYFLDFLEYNLLKNHSAK